MKHQALFSSKDKCIKIKVSSAVILFGAIRVNNPLSEAYGLICIQADIPCSNCLL